MIGDYLVVALVFGIAGSFVFILHHFWLRDAFKEEAQANVPAKEEGTCRVSTPPPHRSENHADCHRRGFPVVSAMASSAKNQPKTNWHPVRALVLRSSEGRR